MLTVQQMNKSVKFQQTKSASLSSFRNEFILPGVYMHSTVHLPTVQFVETFSEIKWFELRKKALNLVSKILDNKSQMSNNVPQRIKNDMKNCGHFFDFFH